MFGAAVWHSDHILHGGHIARGPVICWKSKGLKKGFLTMVDNTDARYWKHKNLTAKGIINAIELS